MLALPGYRIQEKLHQGTNSVIHRAHGEREGHSVILKTPAALYPQPEELAVLEHEHEIGRMFAMEGLVRHFALIPHGKSYSLVLEDFGARSLAHFLATHGPLEVAPFLELARTLTRAVDALHQRDVIHKDICPANILYDPRSGQVKLGDFGTASVLAREKQEFSNPALIEGTLAYLSPEQSGRMNRAIDHRSDFYALGATFYHLLTGSAPFEAADAVELIHCHIARMPVPPHVRRPSIPEPLSAILLKLLAKNAEDRYQSADGLLADLAECARQRSETGRLSSFPLGERDLPRTLRISEKLYGREEPLAALRSAFERTASGQLELLVIEGYSGVGKSAVVRELHKPIAARRGYFAQGKCEQVISQGPRSIFSQVLSDLVRQILTESEERLTHWRTRLLEAFNGDGKLFTDIIPELELIIGEQPPPLPLAPVEARDRFESVFLRFLLTFSTSTHPLVLFLDDLQWVQPASLRLLTRLATSPLASHLLIICACRDNEVPPAHPFRVTLDELAKGGTPLTRLHLGPLGLEHVTALLADTLRCETATALPLAELVLEKTGGNPFFLTQLLDTLHGEGLLRFDTRARRWTWELEQLRRLGVSDNVVDLMVAKIRKYPAAVQDALVLASSLGSAFDLGTIAIVTTTSAREAASHLWETVRDGLLLPLDNRYQYYLWAREDREAAPPPEEVRYRFAHDRIQEAALSQVADEERATLSLRMGRLLLEKLTPEQRAERIFTLVNHLNLGSELMSSPEERLALAHMNLEAARRARSSAAYQSAVSYLCRGVELLPQDAWDNHYELMFGLHRELIECEYLCGHTELAEELFKHASKRVRSREHLCDIYQLMSRILQTAGRVQEGLRLGQECLQTFFGLELPNEPERAQAIIQARTQEVHRLIGGRPLEELVDGPLMKDAELATCLVLLHETWTCAVMVGDAVQRALTSLHMMALSLEHGNTEYSACGYVAYGEVLSARGDPERAYAFGKLAMALTQKFKSPLVTPKVNNSFANFINHYTDHVRTNVPIYTESYQYAQKSGDRWWGAWAATWLWTARFLKGDPLPDVDETGELYLGYIQDSGYLPLLELVKMEQHAIRQLQGRARQPGPGTDSYQEADIVARFARLGFDFGTHIYFVLRGLTHYLYGEQGEALRASDEAHRRKDHIPNLMSYPSHFLYRSLILAASCADATEQERQARREEMAAHHERMRRWAEHGPANYRHQELLISAELARLEGRHEEADGLYEAAIASAQENGFLHHEAIAHELAGAHHLARGRPKAARGYLQEAHYLYARWGASTKVARMEAHYSWLQASASSKVAASTVERDTSLPSRLQAERLDMATVMKASQALSGEIVLSRLLERIVRICMENAGARRGVLVLERDGRLFVEASSALEGNEVLVRALPLEESDDLPRSVLQYVQRTGKVVTLDEATEDPSFRHDPYLASRRVRSVLCLPAVGQAKRRGILYLENNLTAGAFTPERTRVLQLLATQAAISLENAVLYETLEQRVESRTRELKEKNDTLARTLRELRDTQDRMILQSRLAALGSLTAGIAHELRNPLNFVNNFSKITTELVDELSGELDQLPGGLPASKRSDLEDLGEDIKTNLSRIVEHGTRASRIIGSMLEHARGTPSEQVEADLNVLIREYAGLAYQAMRSRDPSFNVTLRMELDESLGRVKVAQQEMGRVLLNLLDNACFAVNAKRKATAGNYTPEIICRTRDLGERMEIRIRDNGSGVPASVRNRIFEPFFSTKPPGEGTGLGLSLSREIIEQGNRGTLQLETEEGAYTEFIVTLPRR